VPLAEISVCPSVMLLPLRSVSVAPAANMAVGGSSKKEKRTKMHGKVAADFFP
jgi:hypothetical protein